MQVTDKVVEANQLYRARYLVGKQRVAEAEQGVYWISWWALDSS